MKSKKTLLTLIIILASILRLVGLSKVPVSLFGDELDVGYHAYSVFKTGRDYQGNFLPLHMHSLAEWRTPLYLYASVPTVAVFGISPLGVRLPAAIFGILNIYALFLLIEQLFKSGFNSKKKNENEKKATHIALIGAFLLSINPWHIQYSRAAFEVTMLLFFVMMGVYYFIRSLQNEGKGLVQSLVYLLLSPLIYSTAKLFVPMLLVVFLVLFFKEIKKFKPLYLKKALIFGLLIGSITAYATLFSGGSQRFGYIGVFSDPTIEPEVGYNRMLDARVSGEIHEGLQPGFSEKFFHNKVIFWTDNIIKNFLTSYSSNFLFFSGDPNPRHSIDGMGLFYGFEVIFLLAGVIYLFSSDIKWQYKTTIAFWIIAGTIPASLTRDGGNHATRLILILIPLIILISFGLQKIIHIFKNTKLTKFILGILYLYFFVVYQHKYWIHNPWHSERWWHYGWKEAISAIKQQDDNFQRVFISMKGEPAWIFFATNYPYPPRTWQQEFPIGNDVWVEGFGSVSHTGKFYFGSVQDVNGGIYAAPTYLNSNDLYLANASEVGENLINDPEKKPVGLELLQTIAFPSGEPAFYLFKKNN